MNHLCDMKVNMRLMRRGLSVQRNGTLAKGGIGPMLDLQAIQRADCRLEGLGRVQEH